MAYRVYISDVARFIVSAFSDDPPKRYYDIICPSKITEPVQTAEEIIAHVVSSAGLKLREEATNESV